MKPYCPTCRTRVDQATHTPEDCRELAYERSQSNRDED